jgi:hypothetical protein
VEQLAVMTAADYFKALSTAFSRAARGRWGLSARF